MGTNLKKNTYKKKFSILSYYYQNYYKILAKLNILTPLVKVN